jgi:beta-N-acetylhexosaminidase
MAITLEQAVGQMFLLSFHGSKVPPPEFLELLHHGRVGGVVLFRHKNMGSIAELRRLTSVLQTAARQAGQPPLLIAADQEGGQLMAMGQGTPFPGNMALGAVRSEDLAYRVGRALGNELSAVGINVDFAPVCDVNSNPRNPVIGIRSFGEDPKLVASLSTAMVRGIQRSGVAATAKHFPGHGNSSSDSHRGTPVLRQPATRLHSVELVPFRAAVKAGVRLVMTAHIAVPALNGGHGELPATLSRHILRGLLRTRMHFKGLTVSDALDMRALDQDAGYLAEVLAAVAAGNDLLLFNHDLARVEPAYRNVLQATRRALLPKQEIYASARRILSLKKWLGRWPGAPLDVIGCQEHLRLACEVARRSITLVRDTAGQLPLRVSAETKIAVAIPRPQDLTPADTSSYVTPAPGATLRRHHRHVDEFLFSMDLRAPEIAQLHKLLSGYHVVIVGTIDAVTHRGQAKLVNTLLRQGKRVIAVALRMPYDLAVYSAAPTYVCTYSILPPAMEALADALFGHSPFVGQLPVTIPRSL